MQSEERIIFEYIPNSNLKTSYTITNKSNSFLCYKFKITQPKNYLAKPHRGIIKPQEFIIIEIWLHKDGLKEASKDKFKCFYLLTEKPTEQILDLLDKNPDAETKKIPILINNLPSQFQRELLSKSRQNSEVKTIINNNKIGSSNGTSTLENILNQKQKQIKALKQSIIKLEQHQDKPISHSLHPQSLRCITILITTGIGIAIGALSALWI